MGNLNLGGCDLELASFNLVLSLELKLANLCRWPAAGIFGGSANPRPSSRSSLDRGLAGWGGGHARPRGGGRERGEEVQAGDRRGGCVWVSSQGKAEQQAATPSF